MHALTIVAWAVYIIFVVDTAFSKTPITIGSPVKNPLARAAAALIIFPLIGVALYLLGILFGLVSSFIFLPIKSLF